MPFLTPPSLLSLFRRLHSEDLGGPPLKKLKQEVQFGAKEGQPSSTTALLSPHYPNFGHPQVGEQSHTEIQQPPPGPESYAPPYRPSLEEDSASLSGESLDGHLQGECALVPFSASGGRGSRWVGRRDEPGVNCLEQGWGACGNNCRLRVGTPGGSP